MIKLLKHEVWLSPILKIGPTRWHLRLLRKNTACLRLQCLWLSEDDGDQGGGSTAGCRVVLQLEKKVSLLTFRSLCKTLICYTPSLNTIISTTGYITDGQVFTFKNVTISRRNWVWRRASGRQYQTVSICPGNC